jgi:uncharacterized membrane protein
MDECEFATELKRAEDSWDAAAAANASSSSSSAPGGGGGEEKALYR